MALNAFFQLPNREKTIKPNRYKMEKKPRKISLIGSRATSVLSVALVLIIVGLCTTLGITVNRANAVINDGTTLLLTLKPGVNQSVGAELKGIFKDAPWLKKYEFTEASIVLGREVDKMSIEDKDALQLLNFNPFGDEFVLYINEKWHNPDSLRILTERLQNLDGVDMVNGGVMSLGETGTGIDRILLYAGIVALILLIISIVLINNTISLSIYSRRFTIHTMKLVGATNSFIRRPFVRAGMWTGVIAGVLAAGAVCGVQLYLMYNDNIIGPWITMSGVALTATGLILLGALIARAAAWRAATNYLNKSYDLLFKK